ncbi:MAG TPA: hypothetical protein VKV26_05875 [Dehalococcoidia bacterium]|nr:hypothetical protein [Dehalococcoidia bacterium]
MSTRPAIRCAPARPHGRARRSTPLRDRLHRLWQFIRSNELRGLDDVPF